VTHLRQIMLEELERRNYAPGTIRCYIRTVEHYARHFHRSPDRLGPEHIRQYQALMFRRWKLAPNAVAQRLAALRVFYIQVLKQGWSVVETPWEIRGHDKRCPPISPSDTIKFRDLPTLILSGPVLDTLVPKTGDLHRRSSRY
jgi:site-specific recombinase XerD